ncbi:hypothetical protein M433DRAFT_6912 [Acidomyces richmondensis BFW]|nr:hypothetical protein M433DRAFT_6912 [Acidomyces richmondensis BFW]
MRTTVDLLIDDNLVAAFPKGSKILSANRHGNSAWATTARIVVLLPDGTESMYFLKCAENDAGRVMMEGEFIAMSELHMWMPHFVPKPHSCGKYRIEDPEKYFFLSEYIDKNNSMPNPDDLCKKLAELHSISISRNGQFGFHATTCLGRQPQKVGWEKNWTVFFTKLLKHVTVADFDINGPWKELQMIEQQIFDIVIPLLIGNLEKDGRTIKPCLIHNDLWEGNTGTSNSNGKVYVFDSAAIYAHNEMEIGHWRCHYNKIHNEVYTKTYLKEIKPSEPEDEWDDRNRMYSIYYKIAYSCNQKAKGKAVRQDAYNDMYYLVDKYATSPKPLD